jgi:hypothetical protein
MPSPMMKGSHKANFKKLCQEKLKNYFTKKTRDFLPLGSAQTHLKKIVQANFVVHAKQIWFKNVTNKMFLPLSLIYYIMFQAQRDHP